MLRESTGSSQRRSLAFRLGSQGGLPREVGQQPLGTVQGGAVQAWAARSAKEQRNEVGPFREG